MPRFEPVGKRAAIMVALLLSVGMVPGAAQGLGIEKVEAKEDDSCRPAPADVRLVPEEPVTHHLAGWICSRSETEDQTVVIASPPGLSDHSYWDWPVHKQRYSFVRHATQAGYAVFNYDRIGTGQSDRPDAASVNVETEAFVLHQLVEGLRSGQIGGTSHDRVVLLGNSLSVFISVTEAGTFQDVDGVINTGVWVGPQPEGLLELFATFYPAQLDPKFADADIPPGYATTQPGSRQLFFHLPATEPQTVQLDEALKDTATLGEAATFPDSMAVMGQVRAPVLSLMGDRDFLFCRPQCDADGPEREQEEAFWSPEACVEVELVADAGHFVQLHPGAVQSSRSLIVDWLDRRVGHGPGDAPSAPCSG